MRNPLHEPAVSFGPVPGLSSYEGFGADGPPGGRPPGYLPGMPTGPATPDGIPQQGNAAAGIPVAGLKTAAIGLGIAALFVGAGVYLYQDHKAVTLARNGGADKAKGPKRRSPRDDDDETGSPDEDEDDDDG